MIRKYWTYTSVVSIIILLGISIYQNYIINEIEEDLVEELKVHKILLEDNIRLKNEIEKLKKKVKNAEDFIFINGEEIELKTETERDLSYYIKTTHKKIPYSLAKTISFYIVKFSSKYSLKPELLTAIIKTESSFNPMAVGPKTKYGCARGLMQVMPKWWMKKFDLKSVFDLHNIDTGIEVGVKIFKIYLREENQNISKALYRYVNGDKKYVEKVYAEMNRVVMFRTILHGKGNHEKCDTG